MTSATLYGVSAEPAALAVAFAETGIELIPKIRPKRWDIRRLRHGNEIYRWTAWRGRAGGTSV